MYITLEEDKPMDKEEVKPIDDARQTEIAEPDFTPGPWQVKEHRVPGYERTIDVIAGNLRVCEVTGGGVSNPKVLATVRANARLFAAAPALYEIVSAIGDRCTNMYAGQRCPAGFKDQKMWCLPCRAVAVLALVDDPTSEETNV